MKILLVEPYGTRIGHFGLYASHLGQELSKLGHEVTMVSGMRLETKAFLSEEPFFDVFEIESKLNYVLANGTRLPGPFKDVLRGLAVMWLNLVTLSQALRLSGFDVLHLLDWEVLSTTYLLFWHGTVRRKQPPPMVLHINPVDFSFFANQRNPLRAVYKLIARWLLKFVIRRFCRAVTVQGDWHRLRLMTQLSCDGSGTPPFLVVRPGTSLAHGQSSRRDACRALRLNPEAIIFLFFGMLRKDKGIDVLLKAVEGLVGNWQLLIAGAAHDWTAQSLAESIARSGQPERVRADVRYIPEHEIERYFAAADAIVLPYREENYVGNYGPMIIACGYGKPVIASDVGEMGCLVRERGLGYAVRPDHAGALREALEAFIVLPEAMKANMCAAARQLAEECSFASMARLLSDIYAGRRQVVASPQSS